MSEADGWETVYQTAPSAERGDQDMRPIGLVIDELRGRTRALEARVGAALLLISQVARGTNAHPYCPGCGKLRDVAHGRWCPIATLLAASLA